MVFRIVGYTEGFRSYRIGLLAVLALCQKMNSWQVGTTVQVRTGRPVLNANPTKVQIWNLDLNLDFLGPVFAGFVRGSKPTNCPNLKFITAFGLRSTLEFGATKSPNLDLQLRILTFKLQIRSFKGSPWVFSELW